MELTAEQKSAVSRWLAEGSSLSDVQKRLASECQLTLTYMDVRLLVLELGIAVKEKRPAPAAAAPGSTPAVSPADSLAGGGVSVDIDRVMRPGSLVSGTVRFSDGVTASWMLDQVGRLALDPSKKGYKPSADDLADFQNELRRVLERQGF